MPDRAREPTFTGMTKGSLSAVADIQSTAGGAPDALTGVSPRDHRAA